VDSQPYGNLLAEVKKELFVKHPYKGTTIGEMSHLDAATLEEFKAFNKKFYIPNNAVLVVAGDIELTSTKKMIQDYFGSIPSGNPIERNFPKEDPITKTLTAKAYDNNIQTPAIILAYRTPSFKSRDAYVLDMISTYLSSGKSSVLYKKIVDEQKQALAVQAVNISQEDYGMYALFALPFGEVTLKTLVEEMDEEIVKLQTDLISEKDYQKLQNKAENAFVNSNSSVSGIANSLARYYMLYGNTNLVNTEIDIIRSITRDDIKAIAKKYLNTNQRLVLEYLPKKEDKK
jgi:predicted Zn-dependent peptidase